MRSRSATGNRVQLKPGNTPTPTANQKTELNLDQVKPILEEANENLHLQLKSKSKGPKRALQPEPYQPIKWAWPVDSSLYDCNGELNEAECSEMQKLIEHFDAGGKNWHPQAYLILDRLLQPLHAALDATGATTTPKRKATIRNTTINLILRAMFRFRCSFWAFTSAQWVELIGTGYYAYLEFNGETANCRQHLIAVSYLLCGFEDLDALGTLYKYNLAVKIFTQKIIDSSIGSIEQELLSWGYGKTRPQDNVLKALCEVLLANRSPVLESLSVEVLEKVYRYTKAVYIKQGLITLSYVLFQRNILSRPLGREGKSEVAERLQKRRALEGVGTEWAEWCQRWYDTSTMQPSSRLSTIYRLFQAGRWLAEVHPEITNPAQWNYQLAVEYVAVIDRITIGQWSKPGKMFADRLGAPQSAKSKSRALGCIRCFFSDLQEWGWIETRFSPARAFATPRSIRPLIGPDPRIIAADSWAKLLWAGLNLSKEDLPTGIFKGDNQRGFFYPLEMVQAITMVWLFGGLRRNEILRLRLGCIRWQSPAQQKQNGIESSVQFQSNQEIGNQSHAGTGKKTEAVCFLEIPVNKTSTAFTKPIDPVVGQAIERWEKLRPAQPARLDPKTGELIQYLFSYRGKVVGYKYLNEKLIPLLCHKAGIAEKDHRGNLTSHRARSTIASQLYNAKEPMSLFELMEWLGHSSPSSTQYYAKISPTKLAKAYSEAGYFQSNLRTIEVLIDQAAVQSGAAASGEAWKYYDLGHGYCTYDFFDQCPHRMACAKCAFYRPKNSSAAQILEAKTNLLRMRQEIPLTVEELGAVEDGLTALENLGRKLQSIPTPAGPSPEQLQLQEALQGKRHLPVIAVPEFKEHQEKEAGSGTHNLVSGNSNRNTNIISNDSEEGNKRK